jgi:hypothetical protein
MAQDFMAKVTDAEVGDESECFPLLQTPKRKGPADS